MQMTGRIGHAHYHASKPLPLWLQNTLVIVIVVPAIVAVMLWTVLRPAPAKRD